MAYKVIAIFTDRQDNRWRYNVGDIFPRQGLSVSDERIKELSSDENRRGIPLIEKNEDDFSQYMNQPAELELPFVTVPNTKRYTKTEINRMTTAELKAFAKEQGVDNAEDITGAELKKVLIGMLDL